MNRIKALFASARSKSGLLDHLIRMYQRYQADTGDRLAAAVTFYWFLSIFPILLIAVYVTSLALGSDAGHQITDGLGPYLGTPTAKAVGNVVQNSAGKAGIIGLVGTLFSGLGWITALRQAIRTVWHQKVTNGNFITSKISDILALVGLFAVIAGSVVLSGAATAASSNVLNVLGASDSTGAKYFTILLSYLLGGLVDIAIFLFLFLGLAKVATPVRQVLRGCVFGAVGFEVLKFFGAFYIARTTSKGEATYGTFAVVVGLLLFLNLISRLVLYTSAFVVTAPYDSDVRPSGTADPEIAKEAGIPVAYAEDGLTIQKKGAPTPLGPALQGSMSRVTDAEPLSPQPTVSPQTIRTAPLPNEKQVRLAAQGIIAVTGALIAAVGVHATKTVIRVARR